VGLGGEQRALGDKDLLPQLGTIPPQGQSITNHDLQHVTRNLDSLKLTEVFRRG